MTSDHPSTSTVPSTPTERADADAQDAARDAAPGDDSTPAEASVVRSGADADRLTADADAQERMPDDGDTQSMALAAAEDAVAQHRDAPGSGSSAAAPSGETEIECPDCGLVVVGDSPRPTAAWFCPRCDYPLFWAAPPPPATPPSARARRRLPGTGGRAVLGAEPCWYCGEMNEQEVNTCFRCAATLPKPEPPVPTIPVKQTRVPVPLPVPAPMVTWPFVVSGTLAGLAIGIAGAVWAAGLG